MDRRQPKYPRKHRPASTPIAICVLVISIGFSFSLVVQTRTRTASASLLRTFTLDLVPALLQTQEYTEALVRAALPHASEETAKLRAQARTPRQARLHEDKPLRVEAVIWEPALRQRVGGPKVMGRQLDRLMELAEFRNVTIQVPPAGIGAYPTIGSPFEMLSFEEEHYDDVVYAENLTTGTYLEEPSDIEAYTMNFAGLQQTALDPDRSIMLIIKIAGTLKH